LINTAVIPAAGFGTRLLTLTKETPKEMVPLFYKINKEIVTCPLIERIFSQLFDAGIRNFCIIVGKKKRAIEDHFTLDNNYVNLLKKSNKSFQLILSNFYNKIEKSNIVWINQNIPKGFGDAVLHAKEFVGNKPFLVHAGDAFVRDGNTHILKLINAHSENHSDVTLYLREIRNPRLYGVAQATKIGKNLYNVSKVEEKPKQPKSNFALMPLYIFKPMIFQALKVTKPGVRNEIQLTDAIQQVIDWNGNVKAIKFRRPDDCIDIGTPENYFNALKVSFQDSQK
jgi:UTP--glucose-1-phosphate uridylyltransferase